METILVLTFTSMGCIALVPLSLFYYNLRARNTALKAHIVDLLGTITARDVTIRALTVQIDAFKAEAVKVEVKAKEKVRRTPKTWSEARAEREGTRKTAQELRNEVGE